MRSFFAIALKGICFFSCALRYLVVVLMIGIISGCSSRQLDSDEYFQWVRDEQNGLHIVKDLSELEIDLQYTPLEYLVLQRSASGETSHQHDFSGLQYYTLKIRAKSGDLLLHTVTNEADKQRRLYHFSYTFQNLLTLEEGQSRMPCVLYHLEQSMDANGYRTFLLGFENSKNAAETARLVINSEFISALPVKLNISKKNIPTVVL
jgi:hypothetical protein